MKRRDGSKQQNFSRNGLVLVALNVKYLPQVRSLISTDCIENERHTKILARGDSSLVMLG